MSSIPQRHFHVVLYCTYRYTCTAVLVQAQQFHTILIGNVIVAIKLTHEKNNMERTTMVYSRLSYTYYCTLTALIEYCTVQIKSKLVDMDRVVGGTTRRARSLQQQGWMLDVGWFLDAMSTPLHSTFQSWYV